MNIDWNHLDKAREGNENSISYLFNKYNKVLLKMTLLITGSSDSAKDVVQESFIRLLRKKNKHNEGSFKNYLTTIAYRLALKEKYRKKNFTSYFKSEFIEKAPSPLDEHIEKETQLRIFDLICNLPEKQKNILILRFYGNLTYEEIAEITQIPIGTVKSRIFYAVKECGKKLLNKGIL